MDAIVESILVVDDQPHVIGNMARMLENEFNINTASSGQEAMALLATNSYRLVVTDLRLPDMCGTALLTHVFDKYPTTARLLLTVRSDAEDDNAMFALLLKPCTPAQLARVMKDTIYWSKSDAAFISSAAHRSQT